MRAIVWSIAAGLGLAAAPMAWAQPATIGEALACEQSPEPSLCLLRAGARAWDGSSIQTSGVMAALVRQGVAFDGDLASEESFAIVRAAAEAWRREAAGESAEAVLAPIAALDEQYQQRGYRWYASPRDTFIYPDRTWRFAAAREDVVRLALARWGALIGDDDSDLAALAHAYASHGYVAEGRALVARIGRGRDRIYFYVAARDFAAAERALRADGDDANPLALLNLAAQAAKAGDRRRARRLALEVLDDWVRGVSAEVIVSYDRVVLAGMAGAVLREAGESARARQYADALMRVAPAEPLFASHAAYALTLKREAGDAAGACALARRLRDQDFADEAGVRRAIAVELARCGDHDAARAFAARHALRDFWLDFYLGAPLDERELPYAGGLMQAAEDEAAAGRSARAIEVLRVLFLGRPFLAASTLERIRSDSPAINAAWADGAAFAALRTRLSQRGRALDAPLDDQDRDAVLAAGLSLSDPP